MCLSLVKYEWITYNQTCHNVLIRLGNIFEKHIILQNIAFHRLHNSKAFLANLDKKDVTGKHGESLSCNGRHGKTNMIYSRRYIMEIRETEKLISVTEKPGIDSTPFVLGGIYTIGKVSTNEISKKETPQTHDQHVTYHKCWTKHSHHQPT